MLDIVVGIILLIAAIFLTVAILMQEGKGNHLSGAIAGGNDNSFFGKNKSKAASQRLSKITTVVAVCFTVVVLILYILQPNNNKIDESQKNPVDPDATSDVANEDAE